MPFWKKENPILKRNGFHKPIMMQEHFTNEPISFEHLPRVEAVSFHAIPKQYLNIVYLNNAILTVILGVSLMLIALFNETVRAQVLVLGAVLLLFIGLLFWMSHIGYRKKGYAVREKDIIFRSGILATTTTIIPFNRIQHVAIHEGFFSRMYELSELQIFTAGGSSSDLHIPGLPKEEAEQIKTYLLNQISSQSFKAPEKELVETIIPEEVVPEAPSVTQTAPSTDDETI